MFKESPASIQHDLFTSSQNLLSGKSLKIYDDQSAWHNIFRNQVTMRMTRIYFVPCTLPVLAALMLQYGF